MAYRGLGRRSRWAVWRPFAAAFLAIALCAVGAYLWSLPTGTGEYQSGPSKKYVAHLSHLSRGTLRGRRAEYAEATVVNAQTGGVLWRMEFAPTQNAGLPDYGDRDKHFIKWADDGASVTFFFGGVSGPPAGAKEKVTVPVP